LKDTTESRPADSKTTARDILTPRIRRVLLGKALIKIAYSFILMHKTAEILVSGYVQAVGYRLYTKRYADHLGVTGFVQNLPDGNVKVVASGAEEDLARFIERLRGGPRAAIVKGVKVTWKNGEKTSGEFVMR
jgi:acylphosphatase